MRGGCIEAGLESDCKRNQPEPAGGRFGTCQSNTMFCQCK